LTARDATLNRLREAARLVPDQTIAAQHADKIAEMKLLRAQVLQARDAHAAATGAQEANAPGGPRGLSAFRAPNHLARSVMHRGRRAARRAASIPGSVVREGGPRATARKALGRLLRDGPGGVGVLFPIPAPQGPPVVPPEPVSPSWYSAEDPEVSIVVLNWNRADVTEQCLRALWQHTAGHTYEIVLVDNGSAPTEVEHLEQVRGPFRLLPLELNRYFGEGNNIGVEQAKAPLVVLMNNDVTVEAGWLEPLMAALQNDPGCGMAGPMFLYPNGLLQEAGGLLDEDANSVQIGKFHDPSRPEFARRREVDYISAACCLLRKEDFERVLGFDMRYEPAYYEDADLCMKLSQLGLRVMYIPESRVTHHESVTTSDTSHGLNLTNISELNRLKFLDRWGDYLRTGRHHAAPPATRLIMAESRPGARTMGLFSPFELTPGGGERYLLTLAMEGLRHGLTVHFVSPAPYSMVRLTALADMFGLDLDGLCVTSLAEARKLPVFDEWVAMSNHIAPPAPGLGVRNSLLCQFPFRSGVQQWRARQPWLRDYERIIVYSDFTAEAVRQRLAEAHEMAPPIIVLTPAVDLTDDPLRPMKQGIVSTGRFFAGDHSKRQDLQIAAYRRLAESGAANGASLHLIGSSSSGAAHRQFLADCIDAARGLDVHFHVDASRAELHELYAASSLYWHSSGLDVDPRLQPERCEHFGIAPIEAMAYGTVPLVVAHGGPAATVRDGIDGYHYSTVDELVQRTAQLLNEPAELLDPMREAARTRATAYGHDAFARSAADLFGLEG